MANPDGVNPYQAPASSDLAVGVNSGKLEDLRSIARSQKGIMVAILAYFVGLITNGVLSASKDTEMVRVVIAVGVLAAVLFGIVCTFSLAIKVYSVGLGIFLGLLTFIPCLGLVSLVVVNQKATAVLKENGFSVGLMGANLADIDARIQAQGRG
jgi:hypothetical protein